MRFAAIVILAAVALPLTAADGGARLSRELQEYLNKPEGQLRIGEGALLICKLAHPELDLEAERKAIKGLAQKVDGLIRVVSRDTNNRDRANGFIRALFEEEKFGLPEKDDAAAFLLSDVMKNKRGNCLGLSILCLAIGEELNFKMYGVPVPSHSSESGHMFVRFDTFGNEKLNFDPVEKGANKSDAYYEKEFKLEADEIRAGYALGNAKKRDVLAILLVNLGGQWVEEGRAEAAIPILEAGLALRKESAAAHSNLGAARLGIGDMPAAERSYLAALRLSPKYFPARIGMAEIALRKGDSSAQRLIEELIVIEPENVQARTMQAAIQIQHNDLKGAIKNLNDLSALPAADVTVWNNLGKCYALSGDMTMAEESYKRALVFDDRSADAHCGLGKALIANGKKTEGLAEIEAALKINPNHAGARAAKAETTTGGNVGAATPAPGKKKTEYPKGTSVLPFKIVSDRIFVQARLNDKVDCEALVDTGTEVTLLNGARVKLGGLRPLRNEELVGDMVGRVAVEMVALDELKLGETVVHNAPVGRMDGGPRTKFANIDFVLGMDVLSRMRFTIDFENSQLILWPPGAKLPAVQPGVERIQLVLTKQVNASAIRPCIFATVNEKNTATFLIDTGADAPMYVAFKKPAELGFTGPPATAAASVYDGNLRIDLPVHMTTFSTLAAGKAVFKDVEARVVDASGINSPVTKGNLMFLNVIGTPFLKTMNAVHFDIAGRTLAIDRIKN